MRISAIDIVSVLAGGGLSDPPIELQPASSPLANNAVANNAETNARFVVGRRAWFIVILPPSGAPLRAGSWSWFSDSHDRCVRCQRFS
jgi:hypothetical protein